ncbi:MAG: hypothetical protein WBC22_16830 [Sedimentisphaerales bacterium]
MKTGIVTIVLLAVLLSGGCATTGQIDLLTDNTKMFMAKVDDYQVVANKAFDLAVRDNFISENTYTKVIGLSNDVNNFKPQLSEIVKAVDEAPDNVVDKAEAGLSAALPLIPTPYGEIALLALGIWKAFGIKKEKETTKAFATESGKRRSEKAGTEKTIRELATMPVEEITADVVKSKLFANIGTERARNGFT